MNSGLGGGGAPPILVEFEADYLASFVAGPRQPAPSVDEGFSKLRQTEATTGLYTMRCTLAVNSKELIVIHRQSKEEMERFPLALMQQVTAKESRDPKESFNNLFIFTVVEDKVPPEIHMFQALMKPASTLADEVRRIKESRGNLPASSPIGNGRWSGNAGSSVDSPPGDPGAYQRTPFQPVSAPRRNVAGTGSDTGLSDASDLDKAEREVYLLNRCFDDIERFVGRIYLSVEAFKELQRRQNQRKKKDKKLGDGLWNMRARMPPLEEFVDCFKKFKLSFNLLARLQDYIHDPNAAELVHFLFTPLSLVWDCQPGREQGTVVHAPGELLACRVVSPLLSVEAISLLRHCLTSKETELWQQLGDAWTTPRSKWTDYVPPYVPRFSDGYQPARCDYEDAVGGPTPRPYEDLPNGSAMTAISHAVAEQANLQRMKEESERARVEPLQLGVRRASEAEQSVMQFPRKADEPFGSHVVVRRGSAGSGSTQGAKPTPPSGVAVPTDPRVNSFMTHVVTHVDRNKRVNSGSSTGPGQLSPRSPSDMTSDGSPSGAISPLLGGPPSWTQRQELFCASVLNSGGQVYRTICEKVGKNNKELTVQKGELLEVLDDSRNWWKMRNADGDVGHIPYTLLKQYEAAEGGDKSSDHINGDSKHLASRPSQSRQTWMGPTSSVPPPPPPPPPPPAPPVIDPYSANVARRKDDKKEENKRRSAPEHAEELTNELKQKISLGPVQPKVIKRPKSVNINQESPPSVVTEWLKVKGFTERTVSILSGKNGANLFRMKRYEMDEILPRDEASRLDSLLTVQKNICGYGTRSSLELRAILRKRKEVSDTFTNQDGLGVDPQTTDEVF